MRMAHDADAARWAGRIHVVQIQLQLTPRENLHHVGWPEAMLRQAIRGKRLGIAVRRQVIIGCFIADFAALREEAIVEVDGGYHARRCGADAARDAKICRLGWRVLRIPAEVVMRDLPGAVAAIRQAVGVAGG